MEKPKTAKLLGAAHLLPTNFTLVAGSLVGAGPKKGALNRGNVFNGARRNNEWRQMVLGFLPSKGQDSVGIGIILLW